MVDSAWKSTKVASSVVIKTKIERSELRPPPAIGSFRQQARLASEVQGLLSSDDSCVEQVAKSVQCREPGLTKAAGISFNVPLAFSVSVRMIKVDKGHVDNCQKTRPQPNTHGWLQDS